jgi:hypothetical protein
MLMHRAGGCVDLVDFGFGERVRLGDPEPGILTYLFLQLPDALEERLCSVETIEDSGYWQVDVEFGGIPGPRILFCSIQLVGEPCLTEEFAVEPEVVPPGMPLLGEALRKFRLSPVVKLNSAALLLGPTEPLLLMGRGTFFMLLTPLWPLQSWLPQ